MKIEKGNILNPIGVVDIVCVTTNGIIKSNGELVMGAGCALEFKNRFPKIPKILGDKIKKSGNLPYVAGKVEKTYIASFPTKNNYKDSGDINLIVNSAKRIVEIADYLKAETVCIPSPGTGFGGLDKEEVYNELRHLLDDRFIILEL